jgi:hypothetical protein
MVAPVAGAKVDTGAVEGVWEGEGFAGAGGMAEGWEYAGRAEDEVGWGPPPGYGTPTGRGG